jgi:hypothetical protein
MSKIGGKAPGSMSVASSPDVTTAPEQKTHGAIDPVAPAASRMLPDSFFVTRRRQEDDLA